MNADANRERNINFIGKMLIDGCHGVFHLQGRCHRVVCIINVRNRSAKEGQEAVTQVLIHNPVMFEDDFSHGGEKIVEDRYRLLWAQLFSED